MLDVPKHSLAHVYVYIIFIFILFPFHTYKDEEEGVLRKEREEEQGRLKEYIYSNFQKLSIDRI